MKIVCFDLLKRPPLPTNIVIVVAALNEQECISVQIWEI